MDLGFKVCKVHATKEEGHNGVIREDIVDKIERAAQAYYFRHIPLVNMHEARTLAYTAFWRTWRALW